MCISLSICLTFAGVLAGQPMSFVRGEITGMDHGRHLYVEAHDLNQRQVLDRAAVNPDGSFSIRLDNAQLNHVDFRVTDQWGNELRYDVVTSGIRAPIEIRLRREPSAQPARGAVSAYALSHSVPGKAQREFRRSLQFSARKDTGQTLASLRKAVEIDPGFIQAHINLGATLTGLGRYEDARAELETALKLDSASPMVHADLAVVNLALHRPADAEQHARKAVSLDPSYVKARFTLGLALAGLPNRRAEALPYLAQSVTGFPNAHLAAAHIHSEMGRHADAIRELEAYNATPGRPQREVADRWIANLRRVAK